MELIPGTLVADRYRAIGPTGMTTAVLAVDHLLGRYVDLFVAPAPSHTQVGALFARRCAVVADLRRPALPLIYDLVAHDGYAVLVGQHLDGPTLARALAANPSPWTVARALRLVATLAEALGLAHAEGLCHGALRAESVVLGGGGAVFIGDLVWPRLEDVRSLDDAAPEARAGAAPTARTDVYLLGMLLDHIVSVAGAYADERGRAVLPIGVRAVLERATARAPEDRYASGVELAEAIRAVLAGADAARHTVLLPVVPAPPRRGVARRLLASAAVTAAVGLWATGGPAGATRLASLLPMPAPLARAWHALSGAPSLSAHKSAVRPPVAQGAIVPAVPSPTPGATRATRATRATSATSAAPAAPTAPAMPMSIIAAPTPTVAVGAATIAAPTETPSPWPTPVVDAGAPLPRHGSRHGWDGGRGPGAPGGPGSGPGGRGAGQGPPAGP